jgi:hypothetical protein
MFLFAGLFLIPGEAGGGEWDSVLKREPGVPVMRPSGLALNIPTRPQEALQQINMKEGEKWKQEVKATAIIK